MSSLDTNEVKDRALVGKKRLPQLFQLIQVKRKNFWEAFTRDYLASIEFTAKSASKKSGLLPKLGDIVIIFENDLRHKWKKAVVTKLIQSEDGQIRRCEVRTANGVITRDINHLYPLKLVAEEYISPQTIQRAKEVVKQEVGDDFEGFSHTESTWRSEAATHLAKEAKTSERTQRLLHRTTNR